MTENPVEISYSVTKELEFLIHRHGNARDALNVTLAHLQHLRSHAISNGECPICFGVLKHSEKPNDPYYECCTCSTRWLYFGVEKETWTTSRNNEAVEFE